MSILHAPYFFSVGKDEPLLYKIAGLHLASTLSQYPLSLHQYITPRPSLMEKSTQTPLTTTRNQATQMDKSVKVAKTQTVEKTLHTQATQTDKSSCDEEVYTILTVIPFLKGESNKSLFSSKYIVYPIRIYLKLTG